MEKPLVCAYCPIHYGKSYLDAAIKSVEPYCDKIVMLYTPTPSYGFGTEAVCPDTEEELKEIALNASPKVEWNKIKAGTEGDHRGLALQYAQGYDLLLAFDSDEVFGENLPQALDMAFASDKRYIGIGGYINLWKSFNEAAYDGFTPIRITNLHNEVGETVVPCTVYHFSCAQPLDIMRYKLLIHGHHSEIRPYWLENIYMGDSKIDLHLTSLGLWNATPFPKETMPEILKQHPFYDKEKIE